MALSIEQQTLIETRIANEAKNTTVAYLLWFFLGFFSGHRFYMGKTGSAVLQIVLNFLIIGLIWTFIDVFMIGGWLRENREEIRSKLTLSMVAGTG